MNCYLEGEVSLRSLSNNDISQCSASHVETNFTSAAGLSDPRSVSDDLNEEMAQYEDQNFQDGNFSSPSDGLTEDTINSYDPFTNEHCYSVGRESSNQQFIPFQHLSNLLPLNESTNDAETALNESLISKGLETFFSHDNEGNLISSEMNDSNDILDKSYLSETYVYGPPLTDTDSISEQKRSNLKLNHIEKSVKSNDIRRKSPFTSSEKLFPGGIKNAIQQSIRDLILRQNAKQIDNSRKAINLPEIPISETEAHQVKKTPQNTSSSVAYEDSYWDNVGPSTYTGLGNSAREDEKYTKMSGISGEIYSINNKFASNIINLPQTPVDETEAYQVKKMPKISSSSTINKDFCWVNFDPSVCSGSGHSVPETEKCDIITTDILKEIGTSNSKTFDMESAYTGEDCRSFEQQTFETSENCNLAVHPLNTETKSLHKELGRNIYVYSENILYQNMIEENDISDEENYLINAFSTVDENDSNLIIRPETASSGINPGKFQEVDAYEIRQQNDGNSITNCNIDIRNLNTEDSVEHKKYQELKIITNNFFESFERPSLDKDQKRETPAEAETETKARNIPSLIRNFSSIDKGIGNHNNNLPRNNEMEAKNRYEHKISNRNEDLTAEISVQEISTPIQSTMNSTFINESDSKKDENRDILKTEVDKNNTYDLDNSNKEHQNIYSSSKYKGSMNNNYNDNPQNNNELTANCKFEHQILNITENSTAEIPPSSEQSKVNSDLINESDSGNTTVFSKTGANNNKTYDSDNSGLVHQSKSSLLNEFNYHYENVDVKEMESHGNEWKFSLPQLHLFGTIDDRSNTLNKACLEKEVYQKNNTISYNNDTPLVEIVDNSDFHHIFNTESQNVSSASASNLNSIQPGFMNIITEDRQKTDLSENMDKNFPIQGLIRSNKNYFAENNRFDETHQHLETASQEKKNSKNTSDNYEDIIKKSRQLSVRLEDIKYKLIPLSSVGNISQDISLRNLQTSRLNVNATCARTDNSAENNISVEKQIIKRISPESQSVYFLRNSKKLKSCKIQPKSIRTTCHAVKIPAPKVEIKNQGINVRSSHPFLNSSNFNFNTTCAVTTDNSNKNNADTEKQATNRTSTEDQSLHSLKNSKRLKSCKIQPKSFNTTCQPVTEGHTVSTENSQKALISSDVRNTNEESISSPIFQMAEILRKFDNKRKETSTSNNDDFVFGPRKFIERKNDGNSSLLFGNSCESTSTGTIFDCTVAAVKQLNNGNGSTVLDILSYVRTHLPSSDKKMFLDIRKSLKDATAAGFLTYTNGKYKEGPNLIKANISTNTNKRKTNRPNDNSKMLSKRVKPTPTQLRSSRPKTTRLANKKSGRNQKDDSNEK
ncbi:putative uncharacterized protein DDB_G0282133 [Argiope bruennichi]|uniref:putative uncharacterized protein DDB_G0282133 n=1 Tax=Argiope bruennichi TaxID=94029 RepID=UPI002494CDA1|nr:putative uncharacterized protein DDB_G0282133 [Argiope bruennichi]